MASTYNYEYYHGVINAKIYKSNDDWVVTFDYTPTMLDVKLDPRIGVTIFVSLYVRPGNVL